MKLVVQELVIHAPVDLVYELLVDPALLVRWLAADAALDPHPGGIVRWTHANGDVCRASYVEVIPPRRLVFTYGWERPEVQIPPGSTTVEIDLAATPTAPASAAPPRPRRSRRRRPHGGWTHYLARLAATAIGTTSALILASTVACPLPPSCRR